MSIIIRLQNLPWAADSVDIRRYFTGLSIPEGGVHIVGGEMGDAFIAFSTDEDARLAMAKDGGKIHEMQIKLLLSSRTEMMRVIEKARQLNLAMQAQALPVVTQPAVLPAAAPQPAPARVPAPVEEDRRRARSPSPHRRGSRDKSPGRGDRRRSPDSRRSKRDRSRSPPRSSRGGNRDTDRRDRSKRDDRRHDDGRGRDDRHSGRESSHDSKKYPETDSFGRQPRSNPPADGYRESNNHRYNDAPPSNVSSYTYDTAPTTEGMKGLPAAFYPQPVNPTHPSDPFAVGKQMAPTVVSSSSTSIYMQQPATYGTVPPYGQPAPGTKESHVTAQSEHMNRRPRFESEYSQSQEAPYFGSPNLNTKASMPEVPYNDKRPTPQDFHPPNRNAWSSPSDAQGNNWAQKRPGILEPPTKNGDFAQVVPMDIEQSPPPEMPPDKSMFNHSEQYLGPRNMPPMRGTGMHNDKQWQASPSLSIVITGLPPDARIEEVQEIFRNISISPMNVCMEANAQGAEKAFIRFSKTSDFQEAVNGPPRYIRNYRCEIIPCPDAVFEAAAASPKSIKPRPKPRQKDSDLCVQLRGLPYSSKESEIQRFFEDLNIVDIAVELSSEGRSVGIAFVQFATEKDFRMALTMNGKMIGHRFITISIASKDHIMVARGLDYTQNLPPKVPLISANDFDNRQPQLIPGPPIVIPPASGAAPPGLPQPTNFCISIKGMPNSVTNQDIVEFLGELSVTIRAIHLMLGPDKRPSGEAFVEFGTKGEATAALNKKNMVLLGSRIFLSPISFDEMTEILKGPKAMPPPPGPGPLLKTPVIATPDKPRRPLIEVPPLPKDFIEPQHNHIKNERPHFDHPANDQQHFGHLREQFPPHERSRTDYPRADRPPLNFPHGERPPSEFPRGDRPSEFPSGNKPPSEYPRGDRPPSEFPRGGRPPSEFHRGDRPPSEFPRGGRPPSEFPRGERPPSEFPRNDRPPTDFPRGERQAHDFPRNDRPPPSDFPRGDRPPRDFHRGERPSREFPRSERPNPDFPHGERPPPDFSRGERPHPNFTHGERPHQDFPLGDRPPSNFPPSEPSHSDFPPDEFPHDEGPHPEFQGERPPSDYPRGERPHPIFPRSNFPRGERPRMDYPRGERPRFEPRFRGGRPPHMERGMRPPFGRMRGPFPGRPGGAPPQDPSSPAGFGAPGCVVSINNLHYEAGLEELYEFFRDYMLTKDNIIRRFDESGRATAEARVSFQCHADALRAVRELNKKPIMGRSLFLSLI